MIVGINLERKLSNVIGTEVNYTNKKIGKVIEYDAETGEAKLYIEDSLSDLINKNQTIGISSRKA